MGVIKIFDVSFQILSVRFDSEKNNLNWIKCEDKRKPISLGVPIFFFFYSTPAFGKSAVR